LGLEFKQPLVLAEGLAQSAVHHDMWYHEYLLLAESKAIKAEESALPLSALVDMERLNTNIRNCSSVYFHRQTRANSGRWAMDIEIARDGVLKNAKAELVTLAARYRVAPPDLVKATAELINTAGEFTIRLEQSLFTCPANEFNQCTSQPAHSVRRTNANSISSSCTQSPQV